jgi:dynein heavy chain
VLDDNKKLCLTSGEVIAMSANMNMIFEPMDLLVASPATVSRCGMVFLQPHEMGWNHLYQSWKLTLPKSFKEVNTKVLDQIVDVIVQPTLDYLRAECAEYAVT